MDKCRVCKNIITSNITHTFSPKFCRAECRKLYFCWRNIKQRCNNATCPSFARYGRRGVKLCPEWMSFDRFRQDMEPAYLQHIALHGIRQTTIDRINTSGDYCFDNCRWATFSEQNRNQGKKRGCTSTFKNVCWHKTQKKWVSYYYDGDKLHSLGRFDSEDMAHSAYVRWSLDVSSIQ